MVLLKIYRVTAFLYIYIFRSFLYFGVNVCTVGTKEPIVFCLGVSLRTASFEEIKADGHAHFKAVYMATIEHLPVVLFGQLSRIKNM